MPHMFTNRPRLHDLTRDSADLRAQFRWETINAVSYKIGGLVFSVGSVLFFLRFEEYADVGARTASRHLHTGHHLASQQAPARFIPDHNARPGFDVTRLCFR